MGTEGSTHVQVSGDDLRLLRVSKHVSVSAVARHYGALRPRISQIEARTRVTPRAYARYMDALRAAIEERERDA
jgi:hypothetical protein